MSETVLLEAKALCAWYGAAQILYDVDMQVMRGEVVALMGRNGAGKSTTLKALMGMLAKRKGTITFLGQDVSKAEPHEVARMGLGYVPEDRRVFADLTVLENLEVGRQPARNWADGTAAPRPRTARRAGSGAGCPSACARPSASAARHRWCAHPADPTSSRGWGTVRTAFRVSRRAHRRAPADGRPRGSRARSGR